MAGRQFFLFSCILLAFPFSAKADEKLVELVKKVKPCVVLIETFDKDNKPVAQGSGFFVNNKGHVVTNYHVIVGAYRAIIKSSSGNEYSVEGIIAKDTYADIVKLTTNIPDSNINFLNLNTKIPSEGEDIVVIGNPLGLESSTSTGIVSAVRDIPSFGKILQITAPVSPDSSGSPVVNMKGEVIGIATLVIEGGQNLNFAIPCDKITTLKEIDKTPITTKYTSTKDDSNNVQKLYDEELAKSDSNDAQKLYEEGLKALWQENWSTALLFFRRAIAKNPQFANAWLQTGYSYYKLGHNQEAIEAYKQTIRIEPDNAEAHFNLGITYDALGRHQEAVDAFKQAIKIKPDDAVAHCNLGIVYNKLGRYSDAIEAFKQAIKINPDFVEAHYNLGFTYFWIDDKESALEEYKILKTLDKELANKLFNLIYQ